MNKINSKIMDAYTRMLLNGDAFVNWKNKPDADTRKKIVECILNLKPNSERINIIMSEIEKVNTEIELNNLLNDWKIKEEEFMI